jgi:hypothetical protein
VRVSLLVRTNWSARWSTEAFPVQRRGVAVSTEAFPAQGGPVAVSTEAFPCRWGRRRVDRGLPRVGGAAAVSTEAFPAQGGHDQRQGGLLPCQDRPFPWQFLALLAQFFRGEFQCAANEKTGRRAWTSRARVAGVGRGGSACRVGPSLRRVEPWLRRVAQPACWVSPSPRRVPPLPCRSRLRRAGCAAAGCAARRKAREGVSESPGLGGGNAQETRRPARRRRSPAFVRRRNTRRGCRNTRRGRRETRRGHRETRRPRSPSFVRAFLRGDLAPLPLSARSCAATATNYTGAGRTPARRAEMHGERAAPAPGLRSVRLDISAVSG